MSSKLTYNGTVHDCVLDIDCPGTSICYYVIKELPKQGYCSCSVEFGNKGLLCDQSSKGGYAKMTTVSLDIIMASVIFLYVTFQLIQSIFFRKIKLTDVRITSLFLCWIALIMFNVYLAVGMYWVSNPTTPFVPEVATGKKRRDYSELRNISLSLYAFFFVAAALNVSILWLEVAIASKKFIRISGPQVSTKYRNSILIFDACVILAISLVNWFSMSLTPVIGIVIFIFVAAM